MASTPFEKTELSRKTERFFVEEKSEEFFSGAVAAGRELIRRRFATSDEALGAGRQFVDAYAEAAQNIEGMNQVLLRVTGPGVKVVNFSARGDEEGRIIFDFHSGTPLADLEPGREKRGYYIGFNVAGLSFADDTYGSVPYIVMRDREIPSANINTQYGFPLSTINIENNMLILCDGSAEIEIPSLDAYRSRNQAIAELALKSTRADRQTVMRSVHRLNRAFHYQNEIGFTPLRQVRDLQMLGQAAKDYSQNDSDKGEALVAVLRETLGRDRLVSIEGKASFGVKDKLTSEKIMGVVIDVLPSHPGMNGVEPTLVLSHTSRDGSGEGLCYVPLSTIQSLVF